MTICLTERRWFLWTFVAVLEPLNSILIRSTNSCKAFILCAGISLRSLGFTSWRGDCSSRPWAAFVTASNKQSDLNSLNWDRSALHKRPSMAATAGSLPATTGDRVFLVIKNRALDDHDEHLLCSYRNCSLFLCYSTAEANPNRQWCFRILELETATLDSGGFLNLSRARPGCTGASDHQQCIQWGAMQPLLCE